MLAWMDEEALRRTKESGQAWFYSRSRQELWHKGETSGSFLNVEELKEDCDGDAILVRVRADGPACHTGAESCFAPWLWRRVAERAKERPEGSYVTKLLADGPKAAAQKVGEEGVEVAVAGVLAALGSSPRTELLAALLYPIGFIAVIVGRQQLFTENTLYPVAVVLDERRRDQVVHTLRLWVVVFVANIVGALAFAALLE